MNPTPTPPALPRCLLLAGLALGCYAGSLGSGFALDDVAAVHNPVVLGAVGWAEAFARDFWGNPPPGVVAAYRPLAALTLRWNWLLGGGSPAPFHATNVALHAACVVGLYLALRRWAGERAALLAAAFFAVFAAPSEAVESVVGRADLLVALAALWGAWAHAWAGPRGAAAAAALLAAGLLSKETGLLLPVAWVAADALRRGRPALGGRLLAYAAVIAGYLLLRHQVLGPFLGHPLDHAENPLAEAAPLERLLGAGRVFLTRYAAGIADPGRRLYTCSAFACGPAAARDPLAWAGLALAGAGAALPLLLRRRAPAAAAGLAWFGVLFLPVSNFVVLAPTIYGERLLYAPGLGLAVALGVAWDALARTYRPALVHGGFAVLGLANLIGVQGQNLNWHDETALFLSGLEYGAESGKVQTNVAELAYRRGDWATMERHARRANEIWGRSWQSHAELGVALDHLGRTGEANEEFRIAYSLAERPLPAQLRVDHAEFLARRGQRADALRVLAAGPATPSVERLRARLEAEAGPR